MTPKDITGKYSIIGTNQDDSENTYKGSLSLKLDNNNRIIASWRINNVQEQFGNGFFKDNILVINFNYKGEDEKKYNGVVVYRCLTNDILDGFWSEENGNPIYLGEEKCFRMKEEKEILN